MVDAHQALLDALCNRIDKDHDLVAGETSSRAWASATFTGARHCYSVMLSGPAASAQASRLAGGLDAMEFDLPGHLVADIALVSRHDTQQGVAMTLEALTVEDC